MSSESIQGHSPLRDRTFNSTGDPYVEDLHEVFIKALAAEGVKGKPDALDKISWELHRLEQAYDKAYAETVHPDIPRLGDRMRIFKAKFSEKVRDKFLITAHNHSGQAVDALKLSFVVKLDAAKQIAQERWEKIRTPLTRELAHWNATIATVFPLQEMRRAIVACEPPNQEARALLVHMTEFVDAMGEDLASLNMELKKFLNGIADTDTLDSTVVKSLERRFKEVKDNIRAFENLYRKTNAAYGAHTPRLISKLGLSAAQGGPANVAEAFSMLKSSTRKAGGILTKHRSMLRRLARFHFHERVADTARRGRENGDKLIDESFRKNLEEVAAIEDALKELKKKKTKENLIGLPHHVALAEVSSTWTSLPEEVKDWLVTNIGTSEAEGEDPRPYNETTHQSLISALKKFRGRYKQFGRALRQIHMAWYPRKEGVVHQPSSETLH